MDITTLEEILDEKERREYRKIAMRRKHRLPVITFCLNLAGEKKRSTLSDRVFFSGIDMVKENFGNPLDFELLESNAGLWAIFVYDENPGMLKKACMKLEDSAVGRIFDLDVTDEHGKLLSGERNRQCVICSEPAAECAREQRHPIEEVEEKINEILAQYEASRAAAAAKDALLEELELTPKPGLVDCNNNGAHKDMDYNLFCLSARAITPYFEHAVMMGYKGCTFKELEKAGKAAEAAMFEATDGVNTHKGAIFMMGIMLCAYGKTLRDDSDTFENAIALAKQKNLPKGTHGAAVRKNFDVIGIVEEAQKGFEIARKAAYNLAGGHNSLREFFKIMAKTEDTNVLYRGGKEALDFVKESAKTLLRYDSDRLIYEAKMIDREFIQRRISPGGSADNYALAVFIKKVLLKRNDEFRDSEENDRDTDIDISFAK